jgi:hypothetical protein
VFKCKISMPGIVSFATLVILTTGLLTGCQGGGNQTFSCSDAGVDSLGALGDQLVAAFPDADAKPFETNDCDSSGKASAKLVVPGQIAPVEAAIPSEWGCERRRSNDLEVYLRCNIDGQASEVVVEFRTDDEVSVYARPLEARQS